MNHTHAPEPSQTFRWIIMLAAAAALLTGCLHDSAPLPADDPGESQNTPTDDVVYFERSTPSTEYQKAGLWTMYSNGTGQKRLFDHVIDFDVSADGTRIAFTQWDEGGTLHLFVMGSDGSGMTDVSKWCSGPSRPSSCGSVDLAPFDVGAPSLSPNGDRIVFAAGVSNATIHDTKDVFTVNLNTKAFTNLTNSPSTSEDTPDFSAAGDKIAFTSDGKLKTMNANGSAKTTIDAAGSAQEVAWQPDVDHDPSTPGDLLVTLRGGELVRIPSVGGVAQTVATDIDGGASWTGDGDGYLYVKQTHLATEGGKKLNIFSKPTSGGGETQITDFVGASARPSGAMIPVSRISARPSSAKESQASLNFTVDMTFPSAQSISVGYSVDGDVNGQEALEGTDFSNIPNGTMTFDPGEVHKTLVVPLIDDSLDEWDEGIELRLSNPSAGASLGHEHAIGTIYDNDRAPDVTVQDATVPEDAGPAQVQIELSEPSGRKASVYYYTSGQTAKSPADYSGVGSGTKKVTFDAGQTTKSAPITIKDDALSEGDETFAVKLEFPGSANLKLQPDGTLDEDARTGIVTIEDDEATAPPAQEEIAFVRSPETTSNIWTVPAGGGTASELNRSGMEFAPSWGTGPNADKLYFASSSSSIWVRNTSSGKSTKVFSVEGDLYDPALSPDGKKVAFAASGDVNGKSAGSKTEIFVLTLNKELSSTNPRRITKNTTPDRAPAWNPDGTQLAFTHGTFTESDIYSMPATGGTAQHLTNEPGFEGGPEWSPDGQTIAFHGDQHGDLDIFFLRLGTMDIEHVTFASSNEEDPTFSPDGQMLAYSRFQNDADIVTLDIATCSENELTSNNSNDVQPDWKDPGGVTPAEVPETGCSGGGGGALSPADAEIVYVKQVNAGFDLWIMNDNGTQQTPLITSSRGEFEPVWSPDGTKVAFSAQDGMSFRQVYVYDTTQAVGTTNPLQITACSASDCDQPAWTPDGTKVAWRAFDAAGGDSDIFWANASNGTGTAFVKNTSDNEGYPQFVDDNGTLKMFFISDAEGTDDDASGQPDHDSEVWVMNASDGSGVAQVTHQAGVLKEHLTLSPDGTKIAFTDNNDGNVWSAPVASGAPTQETFDNGIQTEPDWSADGTQLVYADVPSGQIVKTEAGSGTSTTPLTTGFDFLSAPDWKP